jgi:hypothetical protein
MSSLLYCINRILSHVLADVPLGTSLGLFHLLWRLLSGRLLQSRGAVIPGLADFGLSAAAVRRAWAALAYGRWNTAGLLTAWQQLVQHDGHWQPHRHGGYRPVACDLVGFWRPRLQDCPSKHYSAVAGKALPAIALGIAARVGSVGTQRLALPCLFVRAEADNTGEMALQRRLVQQTQTLLAPDEALVTDRGFPLAQLHAAGITRYVSRAPTNFTARRAAVPAYRGKGRRPTKGACVRPLPRTYKGRTIAATPPDRRETWQGGTPAEPCRIAAQFWDTLVLPDAPPGAPTFTCVVIHDPRFVHPLVLNTPLPLSGAQAQALYRDRWPVEGLPLWAKQMLGAARQFVFAPDSRQRLPELALLAGSILAYTAATQPALSTGFWDRTPRPTAGRLRRVLAQVHLPDLQELPQHLRKKQSPTAHLPTGVQGHRRQKKATPMLYDRPLAA